MSDLVVLIPKLVAGRKEKKPPEGGFQNLKPYERITDLESHRQYKCLPEFYS